MRETAVESHPFGFPLGFARGFGKTGQALFAKCAKKDGAPGLFVMTKVGDETAEVEWLRHPTHRKERDEWGTCDLSTRCSPSQTVRTQSSQERCESANRL